MARFYANENFPMPVVFALRDLGHDVLTVLETGKAGVAEPDENVLAYACADSRVMLTLNRKHFIRLHNEQPKHFGIIVCSFDPDFISQANRIDATVETECPLHGKLLRVNRP